ncbi:PREDICTED: arogenate dehydrogenase 1, chloroplastic-like [Tarenaya hassleriana]|uniref:arogenate dehydrogenase 1, chloroplastic-like n=1 Tax=Tarenaya hassleriana TaxID=28532 RepID=UPI00053C8244|nr:PREDICTED: arogenate dehydrogenase 1, chloroplastic-like [Tarenaya hassleriana]
MAMSASPNKNLKIGIVGFGNLGQFLAETMIKQGHSIHATSRSDYSDLCIRLGIVFFRDTDAFLEADSDVILLCTSILSLSNVLESMPLKSIRRPVLFADVLSVKEHPKDVLLQVVPEDCDILCTHPMFGPRSGKDGWKGLAFMYDKVRLRDEATCSKFLNVFRTEGCKMLEMTSEEHDRLAAKSQFLAHTIGRTLSEMGIKSTCIDTKSFETLLQLEESSGQDSEDLYKGLLTYNRFAKQELKNLVDAIQKVRDRFFEEEEH